MSHATAYPAPAAAPAVPHAAAQAVPHAAAAAAAAAAPGRAGADPVAPAAPRAARLDLYAPIHRALRLFMTDTLVRVGRLDPEDGAEMSATLGQLDSLLLVCRAHLHNENTHVHPAIEARQPGASGRIAQEHEEHLAAIAALAAEAATLRAAPGAAPALRLYRHLALFVAENFEHMQIEETVHNQALWAHYDDAELLAIEQRIVGSLPPDEIALVLRWMTPALPPADRAGWLGAMQRAMPPEAFRGVLEGVRPTLDDKAWAKLAAALNLPARPWPALG